MQPGLASMTAVEDGARHAGGSTGSRQVPTPGGARDAVVERPAPAAPLERGSAALLARLFPEQVINDGAGMIKLEAPCVADASGEVTVTVEVNWAMVLAKAVARLHLVAAGNREPVLARILLIPDLVPPHVCITIRLEQTGHIHAVVECGDGTLLQAVRCVWVMPCER